MPVIKISKRTVDALTPSDKPVMYFDSEVKGFGIRMMPSGTGTYVLEYRPDGGGRSVSKRRLKLARVGDLTPDEARAMAIRHHRGVIGGADPAAQLAEHREMPTLADLAARYLKEEIAPKRKPSTLTLYTIYFDKHIAPRIGNLKADAVTFSHLAKVHRQVGATRPATANRVMNTLSGLYTWARKVGVVRDIENPAKGHERFKESPAERYLSSAELKALGDAIREAETVGIAWEVDRERPNAKHIPKPENARTIIEPEVAAALRLLLFTGARLREILHLKWSEVDTERGVLMLGDSKTGRKPIVLNAPALAVLASIERKGIYVIKGEAPAKGEPEKPRADLKRPWALVTKRAGLEGLRIHDLRHSFASFGAGGGMGLPVIGRLLGHKNPETTQRYAHLADDPLRKASETIAAQIAGALGEPVKSAEVVKMRRGRA
jgi:integrase